jgi:glycosyltransferase involved in cell wall biosynthesis
MKILHFVRRSHPREGGTYTLAKLLNKYLLKSGHQSKIASDPKIFIKEFNKYDLVHFHGIWNFFFSNFNIACHSNNIPYIITTHGMLNPWSLKKNYFIKKFFFYLLQRKNLENADYIHFLNQEELNNSLQYKINNKYFIIPNSVDDEFLKRKNILNNNFIKGIFFGRIAPKKNIQVIIEAMATIKNINFTIDIVGPIENIQYFNFLKKEIKNKKLENYFFFKQPWYKNKDIFLRYDFFILSSLQEGDPFSVKEAMSCGLPVFVSKDSQVNYIKNGVQGFIFNGANELKYLFQTKINKKKLHTMGMRAYRLIKNKMLISKSIDQFIYFYSKAIKYRNNFV